MGKKIHPVKKKSRMTFCICHYCSKYSGEINLWLTIHQCYWINCIQIYNFYGIWFVCIMYINLLKDSIVKPKQIAKVMSLLSWKYNQDWKYTRKHSKILWQVCSIFFYLVLSLRSTEKDMVRYWNNESHLFRTM